MSWEEKELGDVINFYNNQRVPLSGIERSKIQGIYPYHGAQGVVDHINKYIFNGKYILVAEDGENLRSRNEDIARFADGKFWVNNHAHIIKGKKEICDDWFLKYSLNLIDIGGFVTGSAQPKLSMTNLRRIKINLPPLQTQKRIADILSAYDDLIENNLKRIKLLEKAAQNIYKEWFVNMRFPGHENMHISEETGMPNGWEENCLGDIISKLESGSRPKGGIDKSLKEGIPSIGAESVKSLGYFDFSKTKFIKKSFFERMRKGILEDRDILIYKDGAYIGRSTLFQDNFPFEKCSINEHIFLMRAKDEEFQYYLYFTIHSDSYYEKLQNLNSNAAQPGINQKKIKTIPIICPSSSLLVKFDSMIKPMVREIYTLAKANLKLKTARDILLPRLMNRTIEV